MVPDRRSTYFKSFFTQDPDGQTVELATAGPGFNGDSQRKGRGVLTQASPP
jgi:hypothetical protein